MYPSTGFAVVLMIVELFNCACTFANPDESDAEIVPIATRAIEKVRAILSPDFE